MSAPADTSVVAAAFVERLRVRGLLECIQRIAREHHVTVEEMAIVRQGAASNARNAAYLELRRTTSLSYPEIGRIFGRDHTCVVYGLRNAKPAPNVLAARAALRVI